MKDQFLGELGKAVMLIRKRDLRQLGNSPVVNDLSFIIEKSLPAPIAECSPVLLGDILMEVIKQGIEKLRPADINLDSPDRRIYVYLTEYLISSKELHIVADMLHVSRSTFYEIQDLALQQLSTVLWHLEGKAEIDMIVMNNLDRAPYTKFIERFDEQGRNIVTDIIIPELKGGRAWIVALQGPPGVGKSSIAYAVAEEVYGKRDKYLLPFDAVIWISCRRDEFQPGEGSARVIEKSASMASFFETVATTLGNREVLQCSMEEKQAIVENLLEQKVCLLVLDNLDSAWVQDTFKDEIEDYIQRLSRPHKVLVTMRQDDYWRGQATIKISPMNREEARKFLQEEAIIRRIVPFTDSEFDVVYEKTFGTPIAMKQALGLTRINGYPLSEALDFEKYSDNMLDFMFEKAYRRLPVPAQKVFHCMPLFAESAGSEVLEYIANIQGVQKVEALGHLYRGNLIEKVLLQETNEYKYTLLPFTSEYLRKLRSDPREVVDGISILDFVSQASDRMVDYYIKILEAYGDNREGPLLILKTEKSTLLNVMEWAWQAGDERFIKLFDLLGIHLGTMRYLEIREKFGRRAIELCEKLGREKEANWYLIRDVAWSVMRKGTTTAHEEANSILMAAHKQASEHEWTSNEALALMNMAKMALDAHSSADARQSMNKALKLWEKNGDSFWKNLTLIAKGRLLDEEGKLEKAAQVYEDLDNEFIRDGYLNGQIEVKSELAVVRAKQGNCEEALRLAEISKKYAESINPPSYSLAYALSRRSTVKEICGDVQGAIEDAVEASRIYNALGVKYHADNLDDRTQKLRKKLSTK